MSVDTANRTDTSAMTDTGSGPDPTTDAPTRSRRRGGKKPRSTKATAAAAISVYERLLKADARTVNVAAAALGTDPTAKEIAVAAVQASEGHGVTVFEDLARVERLDILDAMVEAADLGDARLGHLWRFVCSLTGAEPTRLPASTIKAARIVLSAIGDLDDDVSEVATRAGTLIQI